MCVCVMYVVECIEVLLAESSTFENSKCLYKSVPIFLLHV